MNSKVFILLALFSVGVVTCYPGKSDSLVDNLEPTYTEFSSKGMTDTEVLQAVEYATEFRAMYGLLQSSKLTAQLRDRFDSEFGGNWYCFASKIKVGAASGRLSGRSIKLHYENGLEMLICTDGCDDFCNNFDL